ncbi:hypothetical protein GCM10023223_14440 [Stackebrandtia albiflava]
MAKAAIASSGDWLVFHTNDATATRASMLLALDNAYDPKSALVSRPASTSRYVAGRSSCGRGGCGFSVTAGASFPWNTAQVVRASP